MTPAEARRTLEQIPGPGLVLTDVEVTALRVLIADYDRLRSIADVRRPGRFGRLQVVSDARELLTGLQKPEGA